MSEMIAVPINKIVDLVKPEHQIETTGRALEEWAMCQALVVIHGRDRGIAHYHRMGGHVFPGADGPEIYIDSSWLKP